MASQEVLVNGGVSNGSTSASCGNGLEQVNSENGLGQVNGDEKGKGNLAEEVLEDLEEYLEDINDRLMISRMVSDSVIKGMVIAVEQEAAEKIAFKELELANLKECLQSHEVGTGKYGDVRLPAVLEAYKVGNYGGLSCFTDACLELDKMRDNLHALRNVAREHFKKVKKEIEHARGSNSMKKIGSGSELVGLGGILEEKQSESWMHVEKMLECLKTTVDTVCTEVGDILLSSNVSLCELQQERELSAKLEDIVIRSVIRSCQEEFTEKLWEQNARFFGSQNVDWLEKFNNISSLGTQLDAILKSLSIPETGLASHGSHELDNLHHKDFSNHVPPATSLYGENGTLDASIIHVAESYDYQQLKHMSKEELVNYFNNIITKMRRDHESALQQKTEECFRLKREYLKERGSVVTHRKDEEFDVLRKKIPEVISKLEDFFLENERFPALTNSLEIIENLKHKLESLLSENCQLRDCITEKTNKVKCLEAQVSAAAAKLKLVENLKSAVEDSCMEASLSEEVYKCAIKEIIQQAKHDSEDSNMAFLITREIYDVILREAVIAAETANRYESLRSQHRVALEQIEVDKVEMHKLNRKLDQAEALLTEANKERNTLFTLAQGMHDKLILSEAREEKLKKEMEMAANGLSKAFDDFERRVSGTIKKSSLRMEDLNSHLKALTKMADVLRKSGLMYKQKLEQRCADLQMAEAEVDLLGDEVEAQLRLLEKIYIALDHYSPVLKHYHGVIEILELVRRELSGESTKLSSSTPWQG